jgi:hypothetical protein
MAQKIIVFIIVLSAALFLARKLFLFFRGKAGPCEGCAMNCPKNADCPSSREPGTDAKKT